MGKKKDVRFLTKDIENICNVTTMTVYNWRLGHSDKSKLPCHTEPRGTRNSIYFLSGEVKKWLEENKMFQGEVELRFLDLLRQKLEAESSKGVQPVSASTSSTTVIPSAETP